MKVEEIHDQLIAFYPAYTDQGSMTRLIYTGTDLDREVNGFDPRQVENVKRALARCYAVDLRAQAKLLQHNYSRQLPLHFYLPDGRVFVPFKLRERRIQGDPSYGYVDLNYIERLLPGDPPGVMLHTGIRLPIYSNIQTARLSYFFGMEIMADLVQPPDNNDQSLEEAVEILLGLLGSRSSASPARRRSFAKISGIK